MYLVTLTLNNPLLEKQADERLKKILQKLSEQQSETISAVKEKSNSKSAHYHVAINEKNNIDNVFTNWPGRVKIHNATKEMVMNFLDKKKFYIFSLNAPFGDSSTK